MRLFVSTRCISSRKSMHVQRYIKKQIVSGFFWIIFWLIWYNGSHYWAKLCLFCIQKTFLIQKRKSDVLVKSLSTFFVMHFYSVSKKLRRDIVSQIESTSEWKEKGINIISFFLLLSLIFSRTRCTAFPNLFCHSNPLLILNILTIFGGIHSQFNE